MTNALQIAWSGGTDTIPTLDSVGHNAQPCTFPGGNVAPTSPWIGGPQIWFPSGGNEWRFLGVNEPGSGDNCLLTRGTFQSGFIQTNFPLLWTRLQGYAAKGRCLYYRHTGGMATNTPGIALHFRNGANTLFAQAGNYPATLATTFTGSGFTTNSTGTGYGEISVDIPNTHNWAVNTTANLEVIGVPGGATVDGQIFAQFNQWVESVRPGIVFHPWAAGGRSIEGFLDNAVFPADLWTNFAPLFGPNRMLWIDLGTNNPSGNTQAQHEAKLVQIINRFRAGSPASPVLITTAYPSATSGPNPYYKAAGIAVANNVQNVFCADTYGAMPDYATGLAGGLYAPANDGTHYGVTGVAAFWSMIGTLLSNMAGT